MFEIRKNLDLRKILGVTKIFLKSRFHCTTLFLGQLWKLDGSTLINRANIWHSSDEWNFEVKGDFIIIENTSNGKVLGIKDSDEVSMEDANNTAEQLWKKEEIEGFFILKNSKSNKVLSAKIKSKYRIHALYVNVLED